MTYFRVASFAHDKDTSISYKKIQNLEQLLKEISYIVRETKADYVSLRILRQEEVIKEMLTK